VREPWAQLRRNPWVRSLLSLKVVNPVRERRRKMRRVTPLFLARTDERLDNFRVTIG